MVAARNLHLAFSLTEVAYESLEVVV